MGLVQDARPQTAGTQSFLTRMLRTGSTNSVSREQQLTQSRSDNQQLRRVVEEKSQENTQLQHQLTQLTRANYQRQLSDTENQQLIATLRGQVDVLQRRMASQSVANHSSNLQEVEFWQVSPEEVSRRDSWPRGLGLCCQGNL